MQQNKEDVNYSCDICAADLQTNKIKIETVNDIDVAYVVCHKCGNRFNFMFDNQESREYKAKLNKLKEVETYLVGMINLEMMKASDSYYSNQYNELTKKEKEQIGEYIPTVTKEKEKEYKSLLDKPKLKDLFKLL